MRGFISQFNLFLFLGWVISWREPLYDEFCLKLTIFTDKYPMHLCTHKANLITQENSNNNNNFPIFSVSQKLLLWGKSSNDYWIFWESDESNELCPQKKKKCTYTETLHKILGRFLEPWSLSITHTPYPQTEIHEP